MKKQIITVRTDTLHKIYDERDALRTELAAECARADALVAAVLKFGEWDIGTRVGDAIAAIESARAKRTT